MKELTITILGTGTSQGVPVIACECEVCKSEDVKDSRLRVSVQIESENTNLVIDTGPDFRQQMLSTGLKKLDGVLFTHEHKDHTAGLDDVRAYNFRQKRDMNVYALERVQEALKLEFSYIFKEDKYPGVPSVSLNTISKNDSFTLGDLEINPIEVLHYKLPVLGFRIGGFTYITDAKTISAEERLKMKGTGVLVVNALRKENHLSHFTLSEALDLIEEVKPRQAYLTHISHLFGTHSEIEKELPTGVNAAFDGLKFTVNYGK